MTGDDAAPVEPVEATEPATDAEPDYWLWAGWIIAIMLLARLVAVAGLRAYVYVDSGEYATLDFSGSWRRPWATPLLYTVLGHNPRYELWGQAVVGAICWSMLALAAAPWFRHRVVRIVVVVAILGLGLTTSVTNWDATVLSESLALSLTALVLAGWLTLARRRTPGAGILLLVATVPWLFVRQSLLPTAWMVVVAAIVGAVLTRGRARTVLAAVAVALVLITGLATASYNRNQEVVHTNLAVIIANRIAPSDERHSWFADHGMPAPPEGQWNVELMQSDPTFGAWLRDKGRSTYTEFLVTHPWYSLTAPLPDSVGIRQSYADAPEPKVTMLSPADAYGSTRPVLPELVEQILFQPGATGTVLAALLGVIVWSSVRRRWADVRWVVPLAVMAISVASLVVGWHGATPELPRLAIVAAVSLRVALILQFAFLVEAELDHRSGSVRPWRFTALQEGTEADQPEEPESGPDVAAAP